jgi:predicted molibdopterin-dependent oxidoreductase YjgC
VPDVITIRVNGRTVQVAPGTTVAVAVHAAGERWSRRSVSGELRGPLCGMGICFECRVRIDGVAHQRGCQTTCRAGMEVETDGF